MIAGFFFYFDDDNQRNPMYKVRICPDNLIFFSNVAKQSFNLKLERHYLNLEKVRSCPTGYDRKGR